MGSAEIGSGLSASPCFDPIHDLADVAPEMLKALRDIVMVGSVSSDAIASRCVKYARAAILDQTSQPQP